jgi:SIR2-like protein
VAPTTDSLNSAKLAAEILKAVSGRDCIAWIGSGLSRPVYDDWPSAISKLFKACGVKDLDGSLPGRKSDQLIDKAEECKQANGGLYEATLADIYGRDEVKSRRAYMWLLKAPFKAYVTTNFDPLLSETAAAFEHTDLFCYPLLEGRDLERKSKPIFYIHGHARPNGTPSGKNLVLARSEFTKAYQGIVGVFVQNLLLS